MYGEDLTGRRFGHLTVIEKRKPPKGRCQWLCKCDCGNTIIVVGNKLQNGGRKTCGCYLNKNRENIFTRKKNRYVFSQIGVEVYDENGRSFIIDYDDYDKVKNAYWGVNKNNYVYGGIRRNGKKECIGIHRYLVDEYSSNFIDHINGDRTDNRKINLRIVDSSQNAQNTPVRIDNKSGVTGVFWYEPHQKWISYININKKRISLGHYSNFVDAVKARYNAMIKYYGEYARQDQLRKMEEIIYCG